MKNGNSNFISGFFKNGKVIKCRLDEQNLDRLLSVINSCEIGDELVLFERTDEAKNETFERKGTPPEKQPSHNLTRIPAEEAQRNKEQWLARNPRPKSGFKGI